MTLGIIIPVLIKSKHEILLLLDNRDAAKLSASFVLFNWIVTVQGLVYMAYTVSILKTYGRRIKDVFSTIDKIKLDWLRNMTILMAFAWLAFFTENLLLLLGGNLSNFYFSSFMVACCVYITGYLGLLKSEVFALPVIAESIRHLPEIELEVSSLKRPFAHDKGTKYEKSGLSPEKAKDHVRQLLIIMETERPYIDCDLTLGQLANRMSLSQHNLSEIINTQLRQNFFDFVNQYRVEQVKKDLTDPAKRDYKLLAIALDAGFSSKTTFNTLLKNTPD